MKLLLCIVPLVLLTACASSLCDPGTILAHDCGPRDEAIPVCLDPLPNAGKTCTSHEDCWLLGDARGLCVLTDEQLAECDLSSRNASCPAFASGVCSAVNEMRFKGFAIQSISDDAVEAWYRPGFRCG